MKKILFIISSMSNGGAEKVISRISACLAEKGYDVNLLTFYKTKGEYNIDERVKRVFLINGNESLFKSLNHLRRVRLLRKKIKSINPDIIFPFLNFVCIYTFFSSFFSKYLKRIVFTDRSNRNILSKKRIIVNDFCLLFIRRILVQNNGQKLSLPKRYQKKVTIIANPVDEKYFNYSKIFNNNCNKIISIGRLADQKDYPLAINAFNNILKKYSHLTYHIFGKGEDEKKIKALIEELGLQDKVILEGFASNINDIYENADLFLMTSKFEGLPNALAESLSIGIPCISSNCDFGPCDLIENDDMGILVDEHTVDAFEKAILHMIDNYSLYVSKSNEIREIMKRKYSLDVIINEWIKLIEG